MDQANRYRLSNLLDAGTIQKMADALYLAVGMPIGIVDGLDGSALVKSGWQDICLNYHRRHPDTLQRCQENDQSVNRHLTEGKFWASKCKNGLWIIWIPITVAGQHLANMFLGPFLYDGEYADEQFFIHQARQFGFDPDGYLSALRHVPVFSHERVNFIVEYNRSLACFIADLAEQSVLRNRSEEKLHEGERRFRAIFNQTFQFTGLLSVDGRILEANESALKFIGKNEQDVMDRPFWETPWWAHSQELQIKVRQAVARAAQGEFVRLDVTHAALNGKLHNFDFSLKPIMDETGRVILLLPEGRDITEFKQAENELKLTQQALRTANENLEQKIRERTTDLSRTVQELRIANKKLDKRANQLRALTGELTMTEHRERKHLSKVLHDGLQQQIVTAKLRLACINVDKSEDDIRQALAEILQLLDESIQISRTLSAELSPPVLHEGGLSEGLNWLVRWMHKNYRIEVDVDLEYKPELPEQVKLLMFESVRELLFNAVKHAKVSRAKVVLQQMKEGGMQIIVSDEGAGFDPRRLNNPGGNQEGFGLFSIRERIALLGGDIEISSAPGKGCRVVLKIPVVQEPVPLYSFDAGDVSTDVEKQTTVGARSTIGVLLADDHALFRNGVARLLAREDGIDIIGQAEDGQSAIDLACRLKPDVILMDISMPRVNGIEATRIIQRECPGIKIIGLSMHEDIERSLAMRDAGAVGYLTKGCEPTELISAIRNCIQDE